jgi:hypothetical protein
MGEMTFDRLPGVRISISDRGTTGTGVSVGIGVMDGVRVALGVGVFVSVGVAVEVGVGVRVGCGVRVSVFPPVGVGEGNPAATVSAMEVGRNSVGSGVGKSKSPSAKHPARERAMIMARLRRVKSFMSLSVNKPRL